MPRPTATLRFLSLAALVAIGAVAAPACARNAPPQLAAEDVGAIMLYVDNHGWDDMIVFVQRGEKRDRLGRVSAASKFSVSLDKWITNAADAVRIIAQPVGTRFYGDGASAATQVLKLEAGQSVVWTIEKDLARSFVEIR
ncbi:MAG: hypothetical protein HY275_18590 [Gemmatimonadetes bacterium]|nr:hypothetical protein [Gemmatimonadota bacterium]